MSFFRGFSLPRPFAIARVALLCVAAAQTAQAQNFTSDRRLLLSEGVLRGSPRVLGIAGAYVGIAEGAEGITRNPAAAATKDPRFESEFNYDFGAAMHFLPPWGVTGQDWDNDNRPDQADGGAFNFLGTQVIYLAASLQYKAVGLGLGVDLQNFITSSSAGAWNLGLVHGFGSLAVSFWEDRIVVGLGVESASAVFAYLANQSIQETLGYHGIGIQFGGLWRPKDENYRVGFAFRPATVAYPNEQASGTIGGLTRFSTAVSPARVSIGGSWAIGPWGRNYNITDKSGWASSGMRPDGTEELSPAMTKFLITTQIDIFFPVSNATYVASFFNQQTEDVRLAGYALAFEPRLAVEKEVVENWFRLRAGGYLEPPLVDGAYTRPHVTFGFELRLFKFYGKPISLGLSFDFAREYQNLSVALLGWR